MNRRKFLCSLGVIGITGYSTSGVYRSATTSGVNSPPPSPPSRRPSGSISSAGRGGVDSSDGTVLDDFEDLSAWTGFGGRLSADETSYYSGSQSARIDVDASTDRWGITRRFEEPIDLSDAHLAMAIRADGPILPRIQLIDGDGRGMTVRTNVRGAFPFRPYDFGIERADDEVDLENVAELRIVEYVGDSERTIWCDDLRALDRPDTGKVMIQFDDGNVTDYSRAYPVLEEYGYPAVTFVNPGKIGDDDHLTVEQLGELRDAGWTVGSHAFDHVSLPDHDVKTQESLLRRSKEWLVERGFEDGAEYVAYPYMKYDADTLSLADDYYTLGFAGGYPGVGRVTNSLEVPRLGDLDVDPAKAAIDAAVRWNGLTQLFFHWLTPERGEAFERIVEYVHERDAAGELDVILPADIEDDLLY